MMKKGVKALYFDTETTGLNPWKNDIIQIACIVEIDGEVKGEFESKVQPVNWEHLDPKALEVHGYDERTLRTFPETKRVFTQLTDFMSRFVNKFDKGDKFTPAGYNVRFDMEFLQNFFKKQGDQYFGSWVNWKLVDPMYKLYEMDYMGKINLPNYKLATVCQHLGIELKAHDALGDIKATRELLRVLQATV